MVHEQYTYENHQGTVTTPPWRIVIERTYTLLALGVDPLHESSRSLGSTLSLTDLTTSPSFFFCIKYSADVLFLYDSTYNLGCNFNLGGIKANLWASSLSASAKFSVVLKGWCRYLDGLSPSQLPGILLRFLKM
jgi:hypothetical protein